MKQYQKERIPSFISVICIVWALCFVVTGCKKDDPPTEPEQPSRSAYISSVDISSYPEIDLSNPTFFDSDGSDLGFLDALESSGVNTVRLRVWMDPLDGHSGLEEVESFAIELRNRGFNIWLDPHYSDTWAHPGQQIMPARWEGVPYEALRDSIASYTLHLMERIEPEYIQIGNELNTGLLHPHGDISTQPEQFLGLMDSAIEAVRSHSTECRVIIHFAGLEGTDWFYSQLEDLDYDIIGLSYYPLWHGKSLDTLSMTIEGLSLAYGKQVLIAETAYPFTLAWNDWTNNILGSDDHLILPEYPATPEGQKAFIEAIRDIRLVQSDCIGFSYWGAELIAWQGEQSTEGSPWENQALFDFDNKALPVLQAFETD